MLAIDMSLTSEKLMPKIDALFDASERKILDMEADRDPAAGAPVFTVNGKYTSRGWTEWTQGFQYGSALLQYDATGDRRFLDVGVDGIRRAMAPHVSHTGVHDHGFNNISTYGNLLRLYREGRVSGDIWGEAFCSLALKVSGAVQAARWTELPDDLGYIYSFNGPHSLFVDTIRTLRVLGAAHKLGHTLMGEQDQSISLLRRLLQHAETTARYNVYFGNGRDIYDERGRTAHEAVFNVRSGSFRCPSTQQGYSPFTTWTRGQAWAVLGYAEQLEFLASLDEGEFSDLSVSTLKGKASFMKRFTETAQALCDYYILQTPTDGIPYWDTGAPGLALMPEWRERRADPFNPHEPVDSSAAAIAAQGLLRFGRFLGDAGPELFGQRSKPSALSGDPKAGSRYFQSGLSVADSLFSEPYLSEGRRHQGLILHSLYHRPNGWDHIPKGRKIPCGEATMWGDYHARELALYLKRLAEDKPYYTFWHYL